MKFLNWTFGSFFRTLGRIFAYISIGLAIAYFSGFLNIATVNAEVIANGESFGIELGGVYNFPHTVIVDSGSEVSKLLAIFNFEGISRPYTYLVGSMCSTGNSTNALDGFYLYNPAYNFYFAEESFKIYATGKECVVSGYRGHYFYIQMQVAKYEDIDGTGEELTASSYLRMSHDRSSKMYFGFNNWYLSSEDLISQLKSDQDLVNQMVAVENGLADIDDTLDAINGTLDSTNDKLDQTNDTLTSEDSDVTSKKCGVVCKLKGIFTGITNLPSNIWNSLKGGFEAITSGITNLISNITNSDSTESKNEAGSFFGDFTTDTFGLTSVITAPLNLISSITSSTCSSVSLPLPYVSKSLTLPCLSSIYNTYFGSFFSIYQLITFGIVAYWVCVRTFALVKDFKNPDHDEIEVLEL